MHNTIFFFKSTYLVFTSTSKWCG